MVDFGRVPEQTAREMVAAQKELAANLSAAAPSNGVAPPPRDDYDDEDDAPLTSEGLRGYESGGDGEPRAAPFAFGFKTAGSPGADQPQIPNLGGGAGNGGGV